MPQETAAAADPESYTAHLKGNTFQEGSGWKTGTLYINR
jgi:hypothetical protein